MAVVGDRILTDILFGNLNGNFTIWTRQIVSEEGDNKVALFVGVRLVLRVENNKFFIYAVATYGTSAGGLFAEASSVRTIASGGRE